MALRIESFDDARVAAWLHAWNSANAAEFAARGLDPLTPEVALRQRDLAGQPLLLLMLALYDADANGLRRLAGDLGHGQLYQRLLHRFAEREVTYLDQDAAYQRMKQLFSAEPSQMPQIEPEVLPESLEVRMTDITAVRKARDNESVVKNLPGVLEVVFTCLTVRGCRKKYSPRPTPSPS